MLFLRAEIFFNRRRIRPRVITPRRPTCFTAPRGFVFCEVPFPGAGIVAFEGRKNMRSFSFCL